MSKTLKREKVLALLAKGVKPSAVARQVGCTASYVYLVKKDAGGVPAKRPQKKVRTKAKAKAQPVPSAEAQVFQALAFAFQKLADTYNGKSL